MKNKTKQRILNLASDLRRISWWACGEKINRDALIEKFLALAKSQKETLEKENKRIGDIVEPDIFDRWAKIKNTRDKLIWAEQVLTASLRLKHATEVPSS